MSLSYIHSFRESDISFRGFRIDFDKLPGSGLLEVFSPYSKRRGLFYHHNEAGADGWGIVSYERDYSYEEANLNTLFDFLHVIGGGGYFSFFDYPRRVEIVSFPINGNREAYEVMYQCLNKFSKFF